MALNVDFKKCNRIGYYTTLQNGRKFKIWLCPANALCAEIHFYKDENGEEKAHLYSFFGDIQHVKNCAKNGHLTGYHSGVTLYAKMINNELWKMVRIFSENGIKVTIK